jgi:general stress protein 26
MAFGGADLQWANFQCSVFWYAGCLIWHNGQFTNINQGQFKTDIMITKFFTQQDTLDTAIELRTQIMELGSALFFSENESLLKLPVHVINNVQVDDDNQIWFLIQRPTQALTEFDAELPAKLEFFKKGMSYHIKVQGVASIVDSNTKVKELAGTDGPHIKSLVAIKVVIKNSEVFSTATPKPASGWLQQTKALSNFFFS